ncbi:D-alanyl-D-alanine carboxypeptidase family protein [Tepidibacter hydrothermalis]|uniref:D-alanyl-D-alanine carboxypeptidase family protein n=1 Tax=Tepidibacter hydrothermalis TaxID=3036126 RepID=A0ABY8EBC2_9FIRM|nr:D-alanyl-D-alanine carboxypeptidase family protein [Tepidibacter hydrothermalis]WFD10251.1 D-alanyl-D-alanine carboxypeptidase family protein [Tepidibacter hydrothermalis]
MQLFTGHKIIKDESGCVAVLYLDKQLNEFALEFLEKSREEKQQFEKNILNYIKKNIPNVKVNKINIMLGSILITSLTFSSVYTPSSLEIDKEGIQLPNNPSISQPKEDIDKDQIPVSNGPSVSQPTENINSGSNLKQGTYIIKPEDTLFKISKLYNITVQQLKDANGLIDNIIYTGQTLIIPNQENSNLENINNVVLNPSDILVMVNKKNSLPSNYIPENLVVPNIPFPFKEFHSKKLMRQDAALALEKLFNKAKQDEINLYATSGYRSYDRQKSIFESNAKKYGIEKANQFSAKPGESEHQTGLAMDVTSPSVNYHLTQRFGETKEGIWLKQNAAQFGFIIRYPKGKEDITGYKYEPWHLRYVGKETAQKITNQNITLEEYFGVE